MTKDFFCIQSRYNYLSSKDQKILIRNKNYLIYMTINLNLNY